MPIMNSNNMYFDHKYNGVSWNIVTILYLVCYRQPQILINS
uniref:Uncharacterized protein n=1 Tax=Arundo donax TaxID=35708 RepID=A0A0A8YTK1_ARUDO